MNNTITALNELAKLHQTRVIDSIEDFDYRFVPLEDKSVELLRTKTQDQILISSDGVIITCTCDPRHLALSKKIVAKVKGIPADKVKLVPVVPLVFGQISKAQLSKKNELPEELDSEITERSDSQSTLDSIIDHAVRQGASDVHIFVYSNYAVVRFRIDGLLRTIKDYASQSDTWDVKEVRAVCSTAINSEAAKNNGVKDHFNDKEPLNAQFPIETSRGRRSIRYSQTPHLYGVKVVMRVLAAGAESTTEKPSLESHGYLREQALLIEDITSTSSGLALISGPTGSGKTTTLGTIVKSVPDDLAVYTYEDPVENPLPNAIQVPVDDKDPDGRCSWTSLSKNSLRLDPDVIMYGEIRSKLVAAEIVHAATTGHFVLGTVHTNSAIGCTTRLVDLGISHKRLAEPGFLKLFVFQRLIRKNCGECSMAIGKVRPRVGSQDARKISRIRSHFAEGIDSIRFAKTENNSCESCGGSGFDGRLLVAEAVVIDKVARGFIANEDLQGWETHLLSRGWKNIMAHAEIHVLNGEACPIVVEKMLSENFGGTEGDDNGFDYDGYRKEINQLTQPKVVANA